MVKDARPGMEVMVKVSHSSWENLLSDTCDWVILNGHHDVSRRDVKKRGASGYWPWMRLV
jgi:hypothetical protein